MICTQDGQRDPGRDYLYMCMAVTNAAKDLGADVADCGIEFRALLAFHGVTTAGDLMHTSVEGHNTPLIALDPDGVAASWWAVAQPIRFMFLEFLAYSLED